MYPDWLWDIHGAEASHALGARYAMTSRFSAVWGHLIGDAIGVPYEFQTGIETVEPRGHGSLNQPPAPGATTAS